jgi:nucleoid DNA-binding protein
LLLSATIITTAASPKLEPIHHWMTVTLGEADRDLRMSQEPLSPADLERLFSPAHDEELTSDAISTRVNSVMNDDAGLLNPILRDRRVILYPTSIKDQIGHTSGMVAIVLNPKSAVTRRNHLAMANLTKRDIVVAISNETGLVQHQVFDVVQHTIDHITEALAKGMDVELRNFGVFQVRLSKARLGRNPNVPGSSFAIPSRATVKFKSGKIMRQRVLELSKVLKKSQLDDKIVRKAR